MSSSKSRRSPFGSARKLCNRIGARKVRTQPLKSRETSAQARKGKECTGQGSAANVPRSLQLWNNVCCGGELRPPRHRMGTLSHLSRLRETTRSEKPSAANGISFRGLLEGGRVLGRRGVRRILTLRSN